MSKLSIAVIQMNSAPDLKKNQEKVLTYLEQVREEVDLVFFPENTLYINVKNGDALKALDLQDDFFKSLVEISKKRNFKIQMCTPILKDGKTYNSAFWIEAQGVSAVYDKVNLFKVNLPGQSFDEAQSFQAGDKLVMKQVGQDWAVGSSICYDLRYSALYCAYAQKRSSIITVPSAFTCKTGRDHWETLLRSRAIESQNFIVAAAQTGNHICPKTQAIRKTYGHSLVIDPWGNVLMDAGTEPGVFYAHLDKRTLEKTRQILPMNRQSPCPSF